MEVVFPSWMLKMKLSKTSMSEQEVHQNEAAIACMYANE